MTAPRDDGLRLNRHVESIDGLRGIAILLVFCAHSLAGVRFAGLGLLFSSGWAGVELFFVLSGFLITSLLLRDREAANGRRRFYVRRALRTWPLYYVVLIAFVATGSGWPEPLTMPSGVRHFWPSFIHLQNVAAGLGGPSWDLPLAISVTWSLAIEEQFYAVWPLVISRRAISTLVWCCVGIVCLAPLVRLGAFQLGATPRLVYLLTPMRLDGLAVGSLIAVVSHLPEATALRFTRFASRAVVLLAVGYVVNLHLLQGEAAPMSHTATRSFASAAALALGYSLFAVGFGGLLVWSLRGHPAGFVRAMGWSPLRWLGRVSYGVYLVHYPLLEWTRVQLAPRLAEWFHIPAWQSTAVGVFLALGAAGAIGDLTARFFERPVLRWGTRMLIK